MPTKNDFGNILPSNDYVDLTIGDTGTTYIAPANGWVFFSRCNNNAASTWIGISGINALSVSSSTDQAWTLQVMKPVKKGEVFRINYILASGSWRTSEDNLRFFYTEGQRSIIKY